MCTVSWARHQGSYHLFFNRDELKTRKIARPPAIVEDQGVHYIAPTDVDAGGTWIAVNEFGLTVCLLNHYMPDWSQAGGPWTSRGLLVRELAVAKDAAEAEALLNDRDLDRFQGFHVLLMDESGEQMALWDGQGLAWNYRPHPPQSSSSWLTREVVSGRRAQFEDMCGDADAAWIDFIGFQSSHRPDPSGWSVCMHRVDAETVSLSCIDVSAKRIQFRYAPGSPCKTQLDPPLELVRRRPFESVRRMPFD